MMKKKLLTGLTIGLLTVGLLSNVAFADYYTGRMTLKYASRGVEVQNLQNDLKDLGYFNFYTTTQYFGAVTKDAVTSYQRAKGLSADGIVGAVTARTLKADTIIKTAKKYAGVPYVWGGVSPSGFDCSGFTHYVFLQNDITIPRVSKDQYNAGVWVNKSALKPSDLVFFTTYEPGPSHVGIYLGNNQFIHASSGAGKITISDLNNVYYSQHYIGAKRVIN